MPIFFTTVLYVMQCRINIWYAGNLICNRKPCESVIWLPRERSQVENHQSRWDTEMSNIHPRMLSFFSLGFRGYSPSPCVTMECPLSPTPGRNTSSHPMGGVGWVRRKKKGMSYSKTTRTPFRRMLEQSLNAEDPQSLLPFCGLWRPWCFPIPLFPGGFKAVVAPSTLVSL